MTQQVMEPPAPVAPSPRTTGPIRLLAAAVGIAALVFGTGSVIGFFMLRTDTQTRSFTGVIHELRVTATDGNVMIRAGAAGTGSAEQPSAIVNSRNRSAFRTAEHTETVTDGVLTVNANCRGGFFIADQCSVDLSIVVPPGTVVNAHSTTGDVTVQSITGPVTASSSTGDLHVDDLRGPTRLSTNVGDIDGEQLPGGTVQAKTNTGDIRLNFVSAPDRVRADSDIGDVRVLVPDDATSYQVNADVSVGDRHIDVPTDGGSRRVMNLGTNTGDVRVSLLDQ